MPVTVRGSNAKRARVVDTAYLGGCRVEARIRHFPAFVCDEPPAAGGNDSGPSPLEYLTAGLSACQTVSIAKVAEAMQFELASLLVHTEADVVFRPSRAPVSPVPRFSEVRVTVEIATSESEARLAELQTLVEERCPASNLFGAAGVVPHVVWRVEPLGPRQGRA